jgi:hypothetical protein
MNVKLILAVVLIGFVTTCPGQQKPAWEKWNWLEGEWTGEGSGKPGQGGGTFSFKPGLDARILIRTSHSEYPASVSKPKVIHEDLMIIYPDNSGNGPKAIYFDNEGHNINYSITCGDKSITFTSDKIPDFPIFRLTYTLLLNGMVNTKFEMSQDGEKFTTYIEGKSKKTK